MCKESEQTFFQRGRTDGQQVLENLLNSTNYQENTSQNHNRSHATPGGIAVTEKKKNIKCWRACEENGIFIHCY